MPRKKIVEEKERPAYLNVDGTLDFTKIFTHNAKQTELLQVRTRYVRFEESADWLRAAADQ